MSSAASYTLVFLRHRVEERALYFHVPPFEFRFHSHVFSAYQMFPHALSHSMLMTAMSSGYYYLYTAHGETEGQKD